MKKKLIAILLCCGVAIPSQGVEMDRIVDANTLDWRVVNDTVMGGRSSGVLSRSDSTVSFTGFLNTKGGGFASIRVPIKAMASERSSGVRLRVKGDGRDYTFRLRPRNSRVSYWSEFATSEGEWIEVNLPFSSFWPNWRGRRLNAPPIDGSQIAEMGLMLNDGRDGNFKVEVEWIASYNNGQAYGL